MKTVLIVNPPARSRVYGVLADLAAIEIPVWSGLIAAYLERQGYDVVVVDPEVERWDVDTTAQHIQAIRPDLAVFTIYGQQPSASTQVLPAAEDVARKLEGIRTLCLGTHPSALPARTMEEGPWTYLAYGEGPETVLGLLQVIEGVGQHRDVNGLWWRDGPQVIGNRSPAVIQDLTETLPDRGFKYFDFKRYRAHNWHAFGLERSPYASLQTSLGCSFRCSFCCINAPFGSASIRFWSAANVLSAFDQLADAGVTNIKIPDEMFVLNPRHVEDICDGLIERGYQFNIWAYARVDTVKNDVLLAKMLRAGFRWLGLGIESGSRHVRDGVAKGKFGHEDIITAVRRVQEHGIHVAANYIFGLPDDDIRSMQETLALACELNTEWANFYSGMGYPGSALYSQAKKRGWRLPDDPGGPGWIGYSQHSYDTLPLPTEHLRAETVLDFRDRAFAYYFGRSEYQALIRRKFGDAAAAEIKAMNTLRMQRKYWIEGTACLHKAEVV